MMAWAWNPAALTFKSETNKEREKEPEQEAKHKSKHKALRGRSVPTKKTTKTSENLND